MSEDSCISLNTGKSQCSVNSQIMSDLYADLYKNYQKLQNDNNILHQKTIKLEGDLIQEKNLKFSIERKHQKAMQDIDHYKMQNLIEKKIDEVNNCMSMEIDFENTYGVNEDNIQKSLSVQLENNELERQNRELERNNLELQIEIDEMKHKIGNLESINEDLKQFIEKKKSELLEINQLKLKIKELENSLLSCDNKYDSTIFSSFAKMDELQVKCFNLENENKKFKENHMNLLLLVEENTSLSNQIKSLEERLAKFDNILIQSTEQTPNNNNAGEIDERKLRHLERENEILKAQQADLFEKSSDLTAHLESKTEKINKLEYLNNMQNDLIEQKKEELEIVQNQIYYLTRECESYRKVLYQFSEQTTNDENVSSLLSELEELNESIIERKVGIEHQTQVLDQLTNVVVSRIENYENIHNNSSLQNEVLGDQKIILELKQQVEQLNDELEKKSQLIEKLNDNKSSCIENTALDNGTVEEVTLEPEHYRKMGFCKDAATSDENNRSIFKILTGKLLEAIEKILGFTVEMGPNGYICIQSCFTDDASQLLEFKIEDEPVLLDNIYSISLKNHLDFQSFPVLLAKITLDLVDQKTNFMS